LPDGAKRRVVQPARSVRRSCTSRDTPATGSIVHDAAA